MVVTLFPPTKPQEVDLYWANRRDLWAGVTHGMRVMALRVARPRDPDRRLRCARDLRAFAETYLARKFYDPQPYHLETMARLQSEILQQHAISFKACDAAPRGIGKTTLRRIAACWAALYRHESVTVFGAHKDENAEIHVKMIKNELFTNQALHEDFPEITQWVRRIGNDPKRAAPVEWSDSLARLPNGSYLVARGIFSGLVGFNLNGMRPGVVFLDDVETLETVESPVQTKRIGRLIDQQLLRLCDPRRRSLIDITGTVRTETCNITRYTDPDLSPGWNGSRLSGIVKFPEREDLWETWLAVCRRQQKPPPEGLAITDGEAAARVGMPADAFADIKNDGYRAALKFYVAHKAEMDAGAELADAVHLPLHECYRIWAEDGKPTFTTELQNQVWRDEEGREIREWNVGYIRSHCAGYERFSLPADCDADIVTLGADVHSHGIYYVFRAWRMDGTSWGIEQGVSEVHVWRDAHDDEKRASLLGGMQRLWTMCQAGWKAGPKTIGYRMGFMDESWETTTVRYFCEDKGGLLYPIRGEGGMGRARFKRSKEFDLTVQVGVDHFKHDMARLLGVLRDDTGPGRGYFFLPSEVSLGYCKHMCAERWQPKGRQEGTDVQEYQWFTRNRNNHWWDCEVYALAAAVASGVRLVGEAKPAQRRPEAHQGPEQEGGWIATGGVDLGDGNWIGSR